MILTMLLVLDAPPSPPPPPPPPAAAPPNSWRKPSAAPPPPPPLLVRLPIRPITAAMSTPPPAPPPASPPEGLSIPIIPSISSGARPFVSACCSRASPPWFWTMLVMFSTLNCCFPERAPIRLFTMALSPPTTPPIKVLPESPPYCSARSSAVFFAKALQHNSLNIFPNDMMTTTSQTQQTLLLDSDLL